MPGAARLQDHADAAKTVIDAAPQILSAEQLAPLRASLGDLTKADLQEEITSAAKDSQLWRHGMAEGAGEMHEPSPPGAGATQTKASCDTIGAREGGAADEADCTGDTDERVDTA